jgi:hypothetical protein
MPHIAVTMMPYLSGKHPLLPHAEHARDGCGRAHSLVVMAAWDQLMETWMTYPS